MRPGYAAAHMLARRLPDAAPPPPIKYRLDITANNGDTYCGMDEFYLIPILGGVDGIQNFTPTGISTSQSSSFGGGYGASAALDFDRSTNFSGWVNGGGASGWLQYQIPGGVEPYAFGLTTMIGEANRMPSEFAFKVGDDGVNWTTVLARDVVPAWSNDETRIWLLDEPAGIHEYGRYDEILNQGDGYCSLGELLIFLTNGDLVRVNNTNATGRSSSDYGGGYAFVNALNRSGGYWVSYAGPPQWVEVYCAFEPQEFGMKCVEPARMPRDFTLSRYNILTDSFEEMAEFSGETGWSVGEIRRYAI